MLSIGEFSKVTGLSNKTLIWYDNIGLLKPDFINEENGYRFYELESIQKVVDIQFWQSMDFTIEEIKNLSNDLIDEKIECLRSKIRKIEDSIYFLHKFKEGEMEKDYLSIKKEKEQAFATLLSGKWRYETTVKNLKATMENFPKGTIDDNMPKYLFFSENYLGTDLLDMINYNESTIFNNNIEYRYFLLKSGERLVLYTEDKQYKNKKNVKMHIYRKPYSNVQYTDEEIEILLDKYSPQIGAMLLPFNDNFFGHWEMYDKIKEDEVENYDGIQKNKNTHYLITSIYDVLDIEQNKVAYIMKEDDKLCIKYSEDNEKILTRDNTKMQVCMSKVDKNQFSIVNSKTKECHECIYKKIKNSEYLFVDLDNSPDLNIDMYVYKKK